ncbi:hypothetical protein [Paenibacillus sp. FSL W7-1287]|uniref:hypothetical protein n=1 Tax=Paenibacillus sp. FSL W7-1287 TaxID=2954538 RepID=UPI0030F81353
MRWLVMTLAAIILLVTGCSLNGTKQDTKPFLFSYELNKVEPQHQSVIDPWLEAARNDPEIRIHTYETEDGYKYSYVKSYKDVEVSYIYTNNQGQLKQRFIKGSNDDEILVVIQYNTSICCNMNIYVTDDQDKYQYPDDFNFTFSYGVLHKNKLDTFENTFTKDLIIDGLIQTDLVLTDDEKKRIYEKMQEINLFDYPEFSAGVNGEPTVGYIFVVERNGEEQTIGWSGGFTNEQKHQRFKSLVDMIIEIINSHEEYKALPEASGGYS